MKIFEKLEKSSGCWFLISISVIFFFLRFPSLFEPNWYGDEGIYQTLGSAMNSGRLLYEGIFDNKPPLLYFLYSIVSSDQFMIRALSLIFGLLAVVGFYFLSKKLFKDKKASFISTSFFAILFGLPLIEGNIANAENFMLFPNIVSGLLILKSLEEKEEKRFKFLISAGLVLGLSFLVKIIGIFDFAAFFIFLFFANYPRIFTDIIKKENLIKELESLITFSVSFFIPILLVSLFFLFNNSFSYYLKAVLFNNVGYVGYGNNFIIPQGLLFFKLLLLAIFSLFIFIKRNLLGISFTFVSLWVSFSLFNAFFSQRPYTHYVLVLLPSFCLMIGLFYLKKNFSKLSGVITMSIFIAVLLNFSFYIKTVFYYQNFISFITGAKSVEAYQKFFDSNTPRDYELAGYINLHTKKADNIFIWGNNAQVYNLTGKLPPGRYTVAYHITNYEDGIENTKQGLEKSKPKFIIIMPNVPPFPFSLSNYYLKISIDGVGIYERFYY